MLKNHEVTTRAVVIGRMSSGEGSVRALIYTEHLGLVRALATSAREERSKLRAHLQVGTLGVFTLVKGAYDWRVIGADKTRNVYFSSLRESAVPKACARVLGALRQLIHGEEINEKLFLALWNFLNDSVALSEKEVVLAERLAMVRILTSLGYVPTQKGIPHIFDSSYGKDVLDDLIPFDRKLVRIINEALLASDLS